MGMGSEATTAAPGLTSPKLWLCYGRNQTKRAGYSIMKRWAPLLLLVILSVVTTANRAGSANPTAMDGVRPRTGGQLYAQRQATLQAGQLYSLILSSAFVDQWQTAWQQPTYQQWQDLLANEATLMAARQGNNPLTVLVGDSLYLWLAPESLSDERLWLNQSISGETTANVVRRVAYFANVRPTMIYVMAGVNDLKNGVAPGVIVSNMELIVQRLKTQHPQARIVVLSILPTRLPTIPQPVVRQVNQQMAIAVRQRGVEFVDIQAACMDSQGLLRIDLTTDGLHLSPQGYSLLTTYFIGN